MRKKKIIAIAGSPSKKRNSDSMLDSFIEGIKSARPEYDVEKFYIIDVPIAQYCFQNGDTPCRDDEPQFMELAEKFRDADGVVIATATYNFSVPACLKNFIDRLRYVALDMKRRNALGQPVGMFTKHRMFFLVSGGTPKWFQKIAFFLFPPFWLRVIFAYYGVRKFGSFYTGNVRAFDSEKTLAKCKRMGRRWAKKF